MTDLTAKPPAAPAPWLTVSNLGFFHGAQEVLSGVELEFLPSRHYILAGPNGAGKSTLLDLLANLKKPASGGIMVRGRPMNDFSPLDLARALALAPQDFRLNFSFTVREVVAMGRRPYLGRWGRLTANDYAAVDRAIEAVDLGALVHKSVTALSGGERQRVVAARALAQETPILLLDEPTSGLDVAHGLALMDLARRRAEAGTLVITVTHDLNLAAPFAHEFVFLKKGRLVAAGDTENTFTGEILGMVYETGARVARNDFAGGPAASFRLPGLNSAPSVR